MSVSSLLLKAVSGIPLIVPGDDLAAVIRSSLLQSGDDLRDGDIIVIAQKIVSKSEGRIIDLQSVSPSAEAVRLAEITGKDPRMVELILQDSNRIVRYKPGIIIAEHRSGIILANAGIDHSNAGTGDGGQRVTLLPEDANASARRIRDRLMQAGTIRVAVIINDSVGRPWRLGTTGIAIGSAGILPLRDLRGREDLFGGKLQVSQTADIDALAGAAGLLMGEADDGTPVILIRGYRTKTSSEGAAALLRPPAEDMFR